MRYLLAKVAVIVPGTGNVQLQYRDCRILSTATSFFLKIAASYSLFFLV